MAVHGVGIDVRTAGRSCASGASVCRSIVCAAGWHWWWGDHCARSSPARERTNGDYPAERSEGVDRRQSVDQVAQSQRSSGGLSSGGCCQTVDTGSPRRDSLVVRGNSDATRPDCRSPNDFHIQLRPCRQDDRRRLLTFFWVSRILLGRHRSRPWRGCGERRYRLVQLTSHVRRSAVGWLSPKRVQRTAAGRTGWAGSSRSWAKQRCSNGLGG